MVPNEALTKALRSLKFSFKDQTDRMMLYKQRGTTRRVEVRRNSMHDETYARTILRMAGMPPDEIEKFIQSANHTSH